MIFRLWVDFNPDLRATYKQPATPNCLVTNDRPDGIELRMSSNYSAAKDDFTGVARTWIGVIAPAINIRGDSYRLKEKRRSGMISNPYGRPEQNS